MIRPTTFSIVAVDSHTGEAGIAVASKFLSVGAVVPWARAGAGAIATQSFANTSFAPRALDALARGDAPDAVAAALVADDDGREDRQFGLVAMDGRAATFTGARCIDHASGITGEGFAAQGNCLTGPDVVAALATAFRATRGHLSGRLLAALRAADRAGGDKRGRQSAALIVEKPRGGYAGFNDRYVDLRVDDHPAPVDELARLLDLHALYYFAPEAHDIIEIDAGIGATLLRELARVGSLAAGHASFDEAARHALVAFMHVENLENRVRNDGRIDRQTLDYLCAAPSPR